MCQHSSASSNADLIVVISEMTGPYCASTVKQKQKSMGKPVKTPSLNWAEALPPPPSCGELEECMEEADRDADEEDLWYVPPVPYW